MHTVSVVSVPSLATLQAMQALNLSHSSYCLTPLLYIALPNSCLPPFLNLAYRLASLRCNIFISLFLHFIIYLCPVPLVRPALMPFVLSSLVCCSPAAEQPQHKEVKPLLQQAADYEDESLSSLDTFLEHMKLMQVQHMT